MSHFNYSCSSVFTLEEDTTPIFDSDSNKQIGEYYSYPTELILYSDLSLEIYQEEATGIGISKKQAEKLRDFLNEKYPIAPSF